MLLYKSAYVLFFYVLYTSTQGQREKLLMPQCHYDPGPNLFDILRSHVQKFQKPPMSLN
jgi:hypothetical protein